MGRLTDIASTYFKRRKYFRLVLLVLILVFWGYSEISDLFPIKNHDLNYKAQREIKQRERGSTFSFAVMGDTKNSPFFNNVISRLNRDDDLLFGVILGDLVLYPTTETYKAFLSQRENLHIPTLVIPGNHDVAFQNRYFYYSIFGRFYYSFALNNAKFIFLDNSNEQNLNDEQLEWMKKELGNGQKYQYRFVFMHVPLWDPRDYVEKGVRYAHSLKDPDFARQLEDLFLYYHVTILFTAHIHAYYDFTLHGLKTIITGGAGAELVGNNPEHDFYHYIKVTVSDKGVNTELVKVNLKTPFGIMSKYFNTAKLYSLTFGRIYLKQAIMGFFILVLLIDGFLEYLYRKKQNE